jgi:hypothetical protein
MREYGWERADLALSTDQRQPSDAVEVEAYQGDAR